MTRVLRGDESLNGLTKPDLFKVPMEWDTRIITSATTLDRTRLGKISIVNSAGSITVTIPADTTSEAYIEGEAFVLYNYGAGTLTIAAASSIVPTTVNVAQYAFAGGSRLPSELGEVWAAIGNYTS